MTKELLNERIKTLMQQRAQLLDNVNAFNGAIQDCEYWLRELDKPVTATILPFPDKKE